ncbi:Gluconokinase [Massilia sp. Bi118]|uniref:gluconokinase n=1 Tax=Massilia sp. Bi118 TaxID=2822346 RepID=UPI001DA963FF|nr:gluconokinase [Massilia sp. Bi118]CAH0311118.1 Gluconokinase [Massilia sp. Bi118]
MSAWVIMGVSGCGKSEVGKRLADVLGAEFIEGDRFHPDENVRKMSAGIALTDADREGWLTLLAHELARACAGGREVVLACSALKRAYRDTLRVSGCDVRFVHLHGSRETIAARMGARAGHFMPLSLLDSQLRDLEPLEGDEAGMVLDVEESPERMIERIMARRSREGGNPSLDALS